MGDDTGLIAIMLLIGIGFSLWIGGGYAPGFVNLFNAVGSTSAESLINLLITAITDPLTLSLIGGLSLAAYFAGNRGNIIPVIIVIAAGVILFTPFTFLASVPLPWELMLLIRSFFGMLMFIAVLSFMGGRGF